MDEEYIIACINGPCYANVIPVQKVVWAYKSVTQVNAVIKTDTSLMVRYANHKGGSISISEKAVDYILQQFMERHRDIVVGHNQEVEKLYLKKDMMGLREYARRPTISGQIQNALERIKAVRNVTENQYKILNVNSDIYARCNERRIR
ncbi:MAG: DUF6709 family protein [Enterocloster bolteae]